MLQTDAVASAAHHPNKNRLQLTQLKFLHYAEMAEMEGFEPPIARLHMQRHQFPIKLTSPLNRLPRGISPNASSYAH